MEAQILAVPDFRRSLDLQGKSRSDTQCAEATKTSEVNRYICQRRARRVIACTRLFGKYLQHNHHTNPLSESCLVLPAAVTTTAFTIISLRI
jgi:hypothetical protein